MLKYLAGPLIGAVIGYFTNYIAVKMLFYPRKEIYFLGHKLPFTPGAIPKGQKRLAGAIGKVVNEELLTTEDIRTKLEQPEMIETITGQIMQVSDMTVQDAGVKICGESEKYDALKKMLEEYLTEEITGAVASAPIAEIIVEKGGDVIKEKTAGTMLQMFLSDQLIASITEPVSREIQSYIQENGRGYIEKEVAGKLDQLAEVSVGELLAKAEPDEEKQKEQIGKLYLKMVEAGTEKLLGSINIAGMVTQKIEAMDVKDLENLVLIVMKKELNMIVNLGALIGLLLGLINLLF